MRVEQVLQLAPGASPPRILVVDDLPSNRTLLTRLLVPTGFSVREAEDGLEALEISERWLPDAVLMDLQMPRMDGCTCTRQIKQARWGVSIAIIIVSGAATDPAAAQAVAAGALEVIAKPFLDAQILSALGKALSLTYV